MKETHLAKTKNRIKKDLELGLKAQFVVANTDKPQIDFDIVEGPEKVDKVACFTMTMNKH